ncbi:unnamed protein product [marine sediment metagenome]|uniref:Uncharacterized protein n=1 Tax=marine sediment metagenome TaxID=412755 RepID=X0SHA8_9ZZZZ
MDPGHSQNSPRGLFAKQNIAIGEGGGLFLEDYSTRTAALRASATGVQVAGVMKLGGHALSILTGSVTGVQVAGGIKLTGHAESFMYGSKTGVQFKGGIRLNDTAKGQISATGPGLTLVGSSVVFSAPGGSIPGDVDRGGGLTIMSNSTGVALCLNTTGTTWRYLEVTSRQRTAGHG